MGLLDFLNDSIGLDAGSQNLRIVKDGKIIFNEPTVISYTPNDLKITGFGDSALFN